MVKKTNHFLHFELRFAKNIWTVFSVIVFLFLSLATLLIWKSYDNEMQAARTFTKNTSFAISEKVSHIFSSTEDALQEMNAEINHDNLTALHRERLYHLMLRSHLAKAPVIAEYYFSDRSGNVIATSAEFPIRSRSRKEFPATAANDEASLFVGDAVAAANGDLVIPMSRKIEDAHHRVIGVLGASIRIEAFKEFYQELGNYESTSFSVANSNGTLLLHYPDNQLYLGKTIAIAGRWTEEGFSTQAGVDENDPTLNGKPSIVAYRKIADFPLYAMVTVTRQEVIQGWLPHLFFQSLLIMAIFLVGWLGAVFLKQNRHAIDTERSDTAHSYTELCDLLAKTNSKMGAAYFESLTLNFAKAFELNHVFVAELTRSQPATAKTIAIYSFDRFDSPLEYLLENTPSHRIMGHEICFFEKEVQALFPKDHLLQTMAIECYLGLPLRNSDGKVIGVLAAMHTAPRPDLQRILKLFQLFAERAGSELERLKKEKPQITISAAS